MSFPFDARSGLIVVHAEVSGPAATAILRLALDTGATGTLINAAMLVSLGYDPAAEANRVQITTGSGVEFVPRISLQKFVALGRTRTDLAVLCHTLPPSAAVDGLLGLDFLREGTLNIDFTGGRITLS